MSAPSGPLKNPIVPRMARIAEGSDSSCQKPASAASPRTRSCHDRRNADQTSLGTDATPSPYRRRGWFTCHMAATHDVSNQPPPLADYDVFGSDAALVEGVQRHEAGWALDHLSEIGRRAGSVEAQEWGRLANVNEPRLLTHDRYGNRIDEVEFHPAWHYLMTVAVSNGLHASPWRRPEARRARRACRGVLGLGPGRRRPRLPDLDDPRRGARASRRRGRSPPSGSRA